MPKTKNMALFWGIRLFFSKHIFLPSLLSLVAALWDDNILKDKKMTSVNTNIAGLTAPKGRVMGHAGAIVSAYGESAFEKVELLKEWGVTISKNPSVMGETVKKVLMEKNIN